MRRQVSNTFLLFFCFSSSENIYILEIMIVAQNWLIYYFFYAFLSIQPKVKFKEDEIKFPFRDS